MKKLNLATCAIVLMIAGCGNPVDEYNSMIESYSYIPFALPLESTRVGTIVHGSQKTIDMYAPPEECFPDLPAAQSLRWLQDTDIPSESQSISFDINAQVNAIAIAGNPVFSFTTDTNFAKSVDVTFEGASIEFLNEMNFMNYFNTGMSLQCKLALKKYPFIYQALRVSAMDFVFKDSAGEKINLTVDNLSKVIKITAGVNWSLNDQWELKITTPKYIGYQLATVATDGSIATTATSFGSSGQWIFVPLSQKQVLRPSRLAEPLSKP